MSDEKSSKSPTPQESQKNQSYRWRTLRARYRSAVGLSMAFKILNVILIVPVTASILHFCLTRWGRSSVGNFEIARFLLSIEGLAAVGSVGAIILGAFYLEFGGLIRLLGVEHLHWWQAFTSSTRMFHRLVELGFRQLLVYVVLAIPFLAAMGLVYWYLWSNKDINGLIVLKPPEFWWGAILAGCIVSVYALLALWLSLRWMFSIPILVFEPGISAKRAMQISIERSRLIRWRALKMLAVWGMIQIALGFVVLGAMRWIARLLLDQRYESLIIATTISGLMLILHTVLAMQLSVFGHVTLAELVMSLFRQVTSINFEKQDAPETARGISGWKIAALLVLLMLASCAIGYVTLNQAAMPMKVDITAHRAGAAHAPENTLAAMNLAIEDQADWVEIDVQLTSDNKLVVMHDSDLARVGGGQRKVAESTLAEIQKLDVGTMVGERFAGEQIPTLQAVLTAAKDRVRLNVELKPHGKADADPLTRSVLAELQRADMFDQCRICSQSYEGLQLVRQLHPQLDVGFIVATAIGDPTELDVDFLMVKGDLTTRKFVDRARARRIAVHAWTINDPNDVAKLVDAGVDNIITDNPRLIRKKLDELLKLGTVERLLLQVRSAILQ